MIIEINSLFYVAMAGFICITLSITYGAVGVAIANSNIKWSGVALYIWMVLPFIILIVLGLIGIGE